MSTASAALSPATSRSRKAAMVVQLLLRDGGDLPLANLPESAQARLTKELGALHSIDRATLDAVAEEFARDLADVALTVPGSIEAALKSLDGRLSPDTIARIREESGIESGSDPWALVLAKPPEDMLAITQAESPEVSAVLLSKMTTSDAASLLGLMPGASARRIAYAMSKTVSIKLDAIARIGAGLAQNYCGAAVPAFTETAEARIGAILNSSAASIREDVLVGLDTDDPVLAAGVRKAIFTFVDIPIRLRTNDVPQIVRDIDPTEFVRALASATQTGGTLAAAAEFLLANMSTRMGDSLREEMSEVGDIKPDDGEKAQGSVVASIRAAADAGTIVFVDPDPDG